MNPQSGAKRGVTFVQRPAVLAVVPDPTVNQQQTACWRRPRTGRRERSGPLGDSWARSAASLLEIGPGNSSQRLLTSRAARPVPPSTPSPARSRPGSGSSLRSGGRRSRARVSRWRHGPRSRHPGTSRRHRGSGRRCPRSGLPCRSARRSCRSLARRPRRARGPSHEALGASVGLSDDAENTHSSARTHRLTPAQVAGPSRLEDGWSVRSVAITPSPSCRSHLERLRLPGALAGAAQVAADTIRLLRDGDGAAAGRERGGGVGRRTAAAMQPREGSSAGRPEPPSQR